MKSVVKPALCSIVCLILGFLSGLSSFDSIETWYVDLNKPVFNPPNWIFGPVWSVLYLMMGVAVGLVWNLGLKHDGAKKGVILFAVQFVLNLVWTPVFFGAHQIGPAFVVICLLWAAILLCAIQFFRVRQISGWLMVPYLLWVSFATVLNGSLWYLN